MVTLNVRRSVSVCAVRGRWAGGAVRRRALTARPLRLRRSAARAKINTHTHYYLLPHFRPDCKIRYLFNVFAWNVFWQNIEALNQFQIFVFITRNFFMRGVNLTVSSLCCNNIYFAIIISFSSFVSFTTLMKL